MNAASLSSAGDPKRAAPEPQLRKFWIIDLPPAGLGHGCTAAAFEISPTAIVDDIKEQICMRLNHSRFALRRGEFQLIQDGRHQPFYTKVETLRGDVLQFHWSNPADETRPRLEYRP